MAETFLGKALEHIIVGADIGAKSPKILIGATIDAFANNKSFSEAMDDQYSMDGFDENNPTEPSSNNAINLGRNVGKIIDSIWKAFE